MVYIHNKVLFSHKKAENPAFCDNIKTNTVCSHLNVESKKSQTHRNRKESGSCWGWGTWGDVVQRV